MLEATSRRLGRLDSSGTRVLSTNSTASSVNSDTTNQAVWKVTESALNTRSSTTKVTRSNAVLASPNTIMKKRTSRMSQRCAVSVSARSTLSVEMVTAGKSDRKLLSRICFGSIGRNGSASVASAIDDHVAEIGAGGDADIFQRVGEGAPAVLDAGAERIEVAPQQNDVGALAGDIDGLVHRDADVGFVERRRIVDAVAEIADGVPGPLQRAHDALLLLRIDLGEDVGALGAMPQRLVIEMIEALAGEKRMGLEPDRLGDMGGDVTVVAGDDLDADAEAVEIRERGHDLGLDRIEEQQEAGKGHVPLVTAVIGALRRAQPGGDAKHAKSLGALRLVETIEPCAGRGIEGNGGAVLAEDRAATGDDMGVGALGDDAVRVRVALLLDHHGQAPALEVVRKLVDLAGQGPGFRRRGRGDDGRVERIVDAGLQLGIEDRRDDGARATARRQARPPLRARSCLR